MDEATALWTWEKRLTELVEGHMFNKQSEEYLAVSRKEKTMVGMPLQRENLNYNSNYLQWQGIP